MVEKAELARIESLTGEVSFNSQFAYLNFACISHMFLHMTRRLRSVVSLIHKARNL